MDMSILSHKHNCFEGWYFKNQSGEDSISFIPAFHSDEEGRESASLQVILPGKAYRIFFPIEEFTKSKRRLSICIGDNIFNKKGIRVNLHTDLLTITGTLRFSKFTPLNYDIMGPFRYIPFLQCRHSIFSLSHNIEGSLTINGSPMKFCNGTGYVEGDRGCGFPYNYMWSQCSWTQGCRNALMISAADVQIGRYSFPGCIAMVYFNGKQYRLATYLGAKIKKYNKKELWVCQGCYDLRIKLMEGDEQELLAPAYGKMSRIIYESITAKVRYRFRKNKQILFDFVGLGGFERGL